MPLKGINMKILRRRRFLVDGKLQLRLVAMSVGYISFYISMMALGIFIPLIIEMRKTNPNSFRSYLLVDSFMYLHQNIWPIVLLVLGIVALHSLFLSHKVAGPLYRFRQIFLALTAGKVLGQQQIRKGDFLQFEMNMINEMLDSLQSRVASLREIQSAIANSISGIVERGRTLSDGKLTLMVEDLASQRLAEHEFLIEK
jgi:methyl-accepting chemotaxis protein